MEKRLTIATHISPSNFLMILPHLELLRKLVFFGMPSATVRKPDWPMVIYVDGHSSCSLCHIILFILSALYWLGKKPSLFVSLISTSLLSRPLLLQLEVAIVERIYPPRADLTVSFVVGHHMSSPEEFFPYRELGSICTRDVEREREFGRREIVFKKRCDQKGENGLIPARKRDFLLLPVRRPFKA